MNHRPTINETGQRVVYARALLGFREHRAVLTPVRSTLCGRVVAEYWNEPGHGAFPLPCLRCAYQVRRAGGVVATTLVGRWWRLLARLAGGSRG